MLPQAHRLRTANDFARVRKQGKSWPHPWFVLVTAPNDQARTRVGFTVSKRVGKAHIRNRVRRQLREVMRTYLPSIQAGFDIIIISRPALVGQSYQNITDAVLRQLGRAQLLTHLANTGEN